MLLVNHKLHLGSPFVVSELSLCFHGDKLNRREEREDREKIEDGEDEGEELAPQMQITLTHEGIQKLAIQKSLRSAIF